MRRPALHQCGPASPQAQLGPVEGHGAAVDLDAVSARWLPLREFARSVYDHDSRRSQVLSTGRIRVPAMASNARSAVVMTANRAAIVGLTGTPATASNTIIDRIARPRVAFMTSTRAASTGLAGWSRHSSTAVARHSGRNRVRSRAYTGCRGHTGLGMPGANPPAGIRP